MKPICVKCQRFYRPNKNGVEFIEAIPNGVNVKPGIDEYDRWMPYKIWMGDLWECPGCGHQLISGVGVKPIVEHFQQPAFANEVAHEQRLNGGKAMIQVNDR